MSLDPFGPNAGLDPSQPVAGLDPFAPDPNAPGPFRKALGGAVLGVKANLFGAGALAARAVGAKDLEQAALDRSAALSEEAAQSAPRVEDIDFTDPESIRQGFAAFAGAALPSIALIAGGGLLGRGLGALASRAAGVRGAAAKAAEIARAAGMTEKAALEAGVIPTGLATAAARESARLRIGTLGGAVTPDVALEAGGIFPEALETGVENPGLRAAVGGVAAGSLDFLPLLAAEKYLRAAGKGGFGALARGAVKGAPVGAALEGIQETGQSVIERIAAGKPLDTPEARSDFINSFVGGAVPGVFFGAGIGAARGRASPVQPAPSFTEPEQLPVTERPEAPGPLPTPLAGHDLDTRIGDVALLASLGAPADPNVPAGPTGPSTSPYSRAEAPIALEANRALLEPLLVEERTLVQQEVDLVSELRQPAGQRRPKGEIIRELRPVRTQIGELRTQIGVLRNEIANQTAIQETPRGVLPKGTVTPWGTVVAREAPTAPVEPVGDTSAAELAVARQKKAAGTLVTSREATLLRKEAPEPTTPALEVETARTAREKFTEVTPQRQSEVIEGVATKAIATHKAGLAFRKGTEKAATNALNAAAVEAAKAPTVEAAEKLIFDAAIATLSGKVNKGDAETFAAAVANDVRNAPTFFSKGAISNVIELPRIEVESRLNTLTNKTSYHAVAWDSRNRIVATATGNTEAEARKNATAQFIKGRAQESRSESVGKVLAPLLGKELSANPHVQMVAISDLKNFARQNRRVQPKLSGTLDVPTKELLPKLTKEFREGGAVREPLKLGYDNAANKATILDGNTRLAALEDAGFTHAPVEILQGYELHGFGRNLDVPAIPVKGTRLLPSELGFKTLIAPVKESRSEIVGPNSPPTVNIGLATNDGTGITAAEVIAALQSTGVTVEQHAVHQSDTEQTVVAQLSRELTPAEAYGISIATRQESIAQMVGGKGELHGPNAVKWRPFNPEYFLTLEGKRAASIDAIADITVSSLYTNGLTYEDFLTLPEEQQKIMVDGRREALTEAGDVLIGRIRDMVGSDVEVHLFKAEPGDPVGSYQAKPGPIKGLVQIATNAKRPLSVADHEGFHAAEDLVLSGPEMTIIRRQFRPGGELFKRVITIAREIDARTDAGLADEISTIPQEARAYGFEFWRRGELQADTTVGRIFDKIRQFLERVKNLVDGLGFRSALDVFEAIDLGKVASRKKREGGLAAFAEDVDIEWMGDVESDVIPGLRNRIETAASKARGRPYWVKSGAEVRTMRATIKKLALEGEVGRDWHRVSAAAVLAWANGNQKLAAQMAGLISNFSPRTPVGLDLKKAFTTFIQFEAKQKLDPGAPEQQIDGARRILTGLNKDGTPAEVDSGGNVRPTGIKRENFFKNLMLGIDPINYNVSTQGATVDMWMAHAFGFANDVQGSVTKSQYNYADAEIKRLSKELGWPVEETQAAIWVAIKARGNTTRSIMERYALNRGWYEQVDKPGGKKEATLFGELATSTERVVKADKQRAFVAKWMELALLNPLAQEALEKANYNYARAFEDIFSGKIDLAARLEGVPFAINKTVAQDEFGMPNQGALFHSRGAIADMDRQMAAGELERPQFYLAANRLIDRAYEAGPENVFKAAFGGLKAEFGGSISRWMKKNIHTPNFTSRFSEGFKNVFTTLNTYDRYRSILVKTMIKEKMPAWFDASSTDQATAFKVLLDRTIQGLPRGSPELTEMMATLSPEQKTLFVSATKMVEGLLQAEFESDKVTMRGLLTTPGEYETWFANRQTQVEDLIEKGYIPLRRFGDHSVVIIKSIVGKDGRTQDLVVARQGFSRQATATVAGQMYQEEIARTGADLRVEVGFQHKSMRDTTISVQQFIDTARRNGVPLNALERERIVKALTSADSVMRNRLLQREGTAGYSEDALRVLNEFGVTMASKIAYAKFGSAIDAASEGFQVTSDIINNEPQIAVDESINDVTGRPNNLWEQEGPQSGFHHNLADELTDYVLVPDHTGGWSRKLRGAAMMYFLGGSISAGMVNVMSVPMLTVPELSIHTNYFNAMSTTLGAWKTTWQHQGILRDIVKLKDQTGFPIAEIDNVPGLRQALIQASEDGRTMDTEIHQIMGMAQGSMYSQSRAVQRAVETWMAPFRISEQTNRITSFISGYKVGRENNLTGRNLYNFAGSIVDSTQNNYNEANRPGAARNPIYALMFMFKSFPLFMVEAVVLMHKASPKSAVFMLLGLVAMTGVQGLPFAETIEDLIDAIAQRIFNSPFNSRRAMRNVVKSASEAIVGYDLSNLVMRGIINDVIGMSVSSRIGAGDFVPGTRLGTADADQGRVLEGLLGAPYAMIKDTLASSGKFVGGVLSGDWKQSVDAVRAGGPIALRNVIKGTQQLQDGYATDSKGRKIIDIGTPAALWQTIGVASADLAKAYELDRIDKQTLAFYAQVRADMQTEMVRALKDGDAGRLQDTYDAARAWDESNPDMPLRLNPSAIRRQFVLSGLHLNERTLKMLPRQLRGTSLSAEGSGDNP